MARFRLGQFRTAIGQGKQRFHIVLVARQVVAQPGARGLIVAVAVCRHALQMSHRSQMPGLAGADEAPEPGSDDAENQDHRQRDEPPPCPSPDAHQGRFESSKRQTVLKQMVRSTQKLALRT